MSYETDGEASEAHVQHTAHGDNVYRGQKYVPNVHTMGVSAILLPFPPVARKEMLDLMSQYYDNNGTWNGPFVSPGSTEELHAPPKYWGGAATGHIGLHQWVAEVGAHISEQVAFHLITKQGFATTSLDIPALVYLLSPVMIAPYEELLIYKAGAFPMNRIDDLLRSIRVAEIEIGFSR